MRLEDLPELTEQGQYVEGLGCPTGWCNEKHAAVQAEHRTINSTEYLVWVVISPCLMAVHDEALAAVNSRQ